MTETASTGTPPPAATAAPAVPAPTRRSGIDEGNPSSYPRRVVLATLGLAPQVLTETLYCLARATPAFVPTEIHVVTTLEGRHRAELTLLDPSSAMLPALAGEYGLDELAAALTPERIHVIAGPEGRKLADIDSDADNAAAADTITALIAAFTADPDCAVHVSIAGGRKTMGFLAGYALSLHGRPQDRLSHVLVGEPFQSHPQFFFPPLKPRVLLDRENRPASTADARLILADIPFVRLRPALAGMPAHAGYGELVEAMQARFRPPRLRLDLATATLSAHGRPVPLKPLTFTFAVALARAGAEGLHWRDLDWPGLKRLHQRLGHLAGGRNPGVARLDGSDDHEALFREQVSRLRGALRAALGDLAELYLPITQGERPMTRTVLPLPPGAIEIAGEDAL